jgi:hypothetical protein
MPRAFSPRANRRTSSPNGPSFSLVQKDRSSLSYPVWSGRKKEFMSKNASGMKLEGTARNSKQTWQRATLSTANFSSNLERLAGLAPRVLVRVNPNIFGHRQVLFELSEKRPRLANGPTFSDPRHRQAKSIPRLANCAITRCLDPSPSRARPEFPTTKTPSAARVCHMQTQRIPVICNGRVLTL